MATKPGFRILIAFSIIFLLGINLSPAQEPYFKGKTIRIVAGFPVCARQNRSTSMANRPNSLAAA